MFSEGEWRRDGLHQTALRWENLNKRQEVPPTLYRPGFVLCFLFLFFFFKVGKKNKNTKETTSGIVLLVFFRLNIPLLFVQIFYFVFFTSLSLKCSSCVCSLVAAASVDSGSGCCESNCSLSPCCGSGRLEEKTRCEVPNIFTSFYLVTWLLNSLMFFFLLPPNSKENSHGSDAGESSEVVAHFLAMFGARTYWSKNNCPFPQTWSRELAL